AAVNRFYFIPRLTKAKPVALPGLRRLVSWELVILIAVVAVTGNLVHEDPNVATSTPQQPASVTLHEGESPLDSSHTIRMSVKSRPGNQVTVVATIIDDDRNIVLPEADLQLNWSLPDQGLGPLTQE